MTQIVRWLPFGGAFEETNAGIVWVAPGAAFASSAAGLTAELSATLGSLGISADSDLNLKGNLGQNLGGLSLSSAGVLSLKGGASFTFGSLLLASAGSLSLSGDLSKSLAALSGNLTGDLNEPILGEVGKVLGSLSLSSQGNITLTGALAASLENLTLVSTQTSPQVPGGNLYWYWLQLQAEEEKRKREEKLRKDKEPRDVDGEGEISLKAIGLLEHRPPIDARLKLGPLLAAGQFDYGVELKANIRLEVKGKGRVAKVEEIRGKGRLKLGGNGKGAVEVRINGAGELKPFISLAKVAHRSEVLVRGKVEFRFEPKVLCKITNGAELRPNLISLNFNPNGKILHDPDESWLYYGSRDFFWKKAA